MKHIFRHIKQRPIIYSILVILASLAILFFSLAHAKTKEHYARAEHTVSVDGIVTDCQYKEETKDEYIGDEWYSNTERYYIVFVEYECNGKTYTWTYKSDNQVPHGQAQSLTVDMNDPEYVFNDGNPGEALLVLGTVCTVIFVFIVSIWAFGEIAIFCMFTLGAVGFLIASVSSALSNGPWFLFFFGFAGFSVVSYLLFRGISRENNEKKAMDNSFK